MNPQATAAPRQRSSVWPYAVILLLLFWVLFPQSHDWVGGVITVEAPETTINRVPVLPTAIPQPPAVIAPAPPIVQAPAAPVAPPVPTIAPTAAPTAVPAPAPVERGAAIAVGGGGLGAQQDPEAAYRAAWEAAGKQAGKGAAVAVGGGLGAQP